MLNPSKSNVNFCIRFIGVKKWNEILKEKSDLLPVTEADYLSSAVTQFLNV